MAQLVRALPSHGRGHRFESCYAHSQKPYATGNLDADDSPRATDRATEAPPPGPGDSTGQRTAWRATWCRLTTYAPGMTKTRTQTVRVRGHAEDDVRACGGAYNVWSDGSGSWQRRSPLVSAVDDVVATRAEYRCLWCGKPVGRTTEYVAEATGEMVVLFAGRDGAGRTAHTFLHPDLGTDPTAACATHGALALTRADLGRTVLRSRELQRRRGRRNDTERTTITVQLPPVGDTPRTSVNQRAGSTAGDSAVQ